MSDFVKWFFEGLGTEIISLIIGAAVGCIIGFKAGKRTAKLSQKQTAGISAQQEQKGKASVAGSEKRTEANIVVSQIQEAGDNAEQIQVGESKDVR
jgi:hypothetical protein